MKKNGRGEKIFFRTAFTLCDNNGYSSTQVLNFFLKNNFGMTDDPGDADYIVVSTCGFDQERENESFAVVDGLVRDYGEGRRVVVCGCLAKINPESFKDLGVTLIGPKEHDTFNAVFNACVKIQDVSGSRIDPHFISSDYGFMDAYYIQVCQGCVNRCSYCAIKKAKGQVKSKTIEAVLAEMRMGISLGYRRFVLLGDDCGSYGADIGTDLAGLLNSMDNEDVRIHINYIEPGRFLAIHGKISKNAYDRIDFMNVPVQSSSPRIIGLMNRRYDVAKVTEAVKAVKEEHPHVFIETHVIYGFPGETRDEFMKSFDLADSFDSVIYFYYTDRKNVVSTLLPGKITADEVILRTEEITKHPRFSWEPEKAEAPLVLLGYAMERPRLIESIRNNCSC
jgi:MiaB/RimO family radical SAM methylthiotransferase